MMTLQAHSSRVNFKVNTPIGLGRALMEKQVRVVFILCTSCINHFIPITK